MKETKQLLETFTGLEAEMQKFNELAKEVLNCIEKQEFVPEKLNTDMMQSIIELNKKQKDCFGLYSQVKPGEVTPKQMKSMRSQIDEQLVFDKKADYLDAVQKSFISLHADDLEIDKQISDFKEKMKQIDPTKRKIEDCLKDIRPYAVFISMVKEDDPVKSFEQVPVLIEFFGSELVAHITVIKDIHIGEGAKRFKLDEIEAVDTVSVTPAKESETAPAKEKEAVAKATSSATTTTTTSATASSIFADTAKESPFIDAGKTDSVTTPITSVSSAQMTLPKELQKIKEEEDRKDAERKKEEEKMLELERRKEEQRLREEEKKRVELERKENLKALLEEESFSESKLDDSELKNMQKKNKKEESRFLKLRSANALGGNAKIQMW